MEHSNDFFSSKSLHHSVIVLFFTIHSGDVFMTNFTFYLLVHFFKLFYYFPLSSFSYYWFTQLILLFVQVETTHLLSIEVIMSIVFFIWIRGNTLELCALDWRLLFQILFVRWSTSIKWLSILLFIFTYNSYEVIM